MLKRLSVVVLAAFALACGGDERPLLMTGAEGSTFQRQDVPSTGPSPVAYVPYTTWNRGSATAFIPTCGARALPAVERLVNGSWQPYVIGFCIDVMLETPIELRAAQSRHDQVAIGDAGRFRIRLPYGNGAQSTNHFEAVSPPFDVQ